jgi:hypothetical protein
MLRRIAIGGCLALVLLLGTLVFRASLDDSRPYIAESLLIVRPFSDVLLRRSFEREVRGSSAGIRLLGFAVSRSGVTTPKATSWQTNGIIRLVAAGGTAAEAERLANNAADGIRAALRQHYGISATAIGRAYSAPSSALHEPFRLRFGNGNATQAQFPTAGRVFFQRVALSIDPGISWVRSYAIGREPECDLTLVGRGEFNGGFISAFRLGREFTDVQSGVGELRDAAHRSKGVIEPSWKEEPFVTASGLHGVRTSFTQQYPSASPVGMAIMTQITHDFLLTNAQSRCVCIRFVSASSSYARPGNDVSKSGSEEVQRTIERTLRVE